MVSQPTIHDDTAASQLAAEILALEAAGKPTGQMRRRWRDAVDALRRPVRLAYSRPAIERSEDMPI